jgi:hypothetical protein
MAGLFSRPKAPPTPAPEPVIPLPDDEAVKMSKMKTYAGKQRKSGRLSTILTQNDSLGG